MFACDCGYKTSRSERLEKHCRERGHGNYARKSRWKGYKKPTAKKAAAKKSGK